MVFPFGMTHTQIQIKITMVKIFFNLEKTWMSKSKMPQKGKSINGSNKKGKMS